MELDFLGGVSQVSHQLEGMEWMGRQLINTDR